MILEALSYTIARMANILIIDDDEILLAALAQFLQSEGHSVTVTADGPRGIELVRDNRPDLVLLDLGLPSMSGLEVLKELKRVSEATRVIMMSGYLDPHNMQEAKDAGAISFIDKIADLNMLLHSIAAAVNGHGDAVVEAPRTPPGIAGPPVLNQAADVRTQPHSGSPARCAIGTWSWGERGWGYGATHTEHDVAEAFRVCAERGVSYFDTAESYGNGESERVLGRCIRAFEKPVCIATKFSAGRWQVRRKDVVDACRGSLRRLGVEQIDLYQIHWPTRLASVEQRMDALAEIVERGMAKRVGVSNYSLDQIRRAQDRLAHWNLKLASVQLEYSILHPQPEQNGILQHCLENRIEFLAYSPLAMGMLSGKYSETTPPQGSRSLRYPAHFLSSIRDLINVLIRIGTDHGRSSVQVALNWVLCKGAIPIVGVKNRRQAEENLKAIDWKLTDAEIKSLDAVERSWMN